MTEIPERPGTETQELRKQAFEELMQTEDARLGNPDGPEIERECASGGAAEEPWLAFTTADRVGLALSGGGIRSATFNLGLLQGLRHKKLLGHIDYLSTVSGGGYIGGFWTKWLKVLKPSADAALKKVAQKKGTTPESACFPSLDSQPVNEHHSVTEIREPEEIRHLREFSRFLMPRVGFLREEMWAGIVAVLSGLLPALVLASGTLATIICAWGLIVSPVLHLERFRWAAPLILIVITAGVFIWRERADRHSREVQGLGSFVFFSLVSLIALASIWHWGHGQFFAWTDAPQYRVRLSPLHRLHALDKEWALNLRVFAPALLWLACVPFVLLFRIVILRCRTKAAHVASVAASDRVLMRLLASAVVWSVLGVAWECATALFYLSRWAVPAAGTGAVSASAVFVWLRKWLAAEPSRSRAEGLMTRLKPILPQLAANIAVFLMLVLVAHLLMKVAYRGFPFCMLWSFAGLALVLVSLFALNPSKVGLHDFYRSRICRAYLGAANRRDTGPRPASANRMTTEGPDDDIDLCAWLSELNKNSAAQLRPLHLVCCTANNLSADRLGTLYRGARSAVVSVHGVSVGGRTVVPAEMQFSSALTASAAAFNSNMGSISMRLGPAVTFLLSSLNLRLGLWVPNPLWFHEHLRDSQAVHPNRWKEQVTAVPASDAGEPANEASNVEAPFQREPHKSASLAKAMRGGVEMMKSTGACFYRDMRGAFQWNERKPLFPGVYFFKELFGRTNCDRKSKYIHLSDGGHFENLALYELIRRHCRYVVVSDCGADPDVAFDDFGNALRRIREDFGVEIEIDLAPLKPGADGLSKQHMVVGTIHYDGVVGNDKGTLLYFKPALTGDEPYDITQYRTRNPDFPHESTGDQFYDEAQWEAYRRLGEHAAHSSLRFVERMGSERRNIPAEIFKQARTDWYPAMPGLEQNFLELTNRCSELESEIRDHAPETLRAEFFPEVAAVLGLHRNGAVDLSGKSALERQQFEEKVAQENVKILYYLLQVAQVMEDAWLACHLDMHWAHPLNQGWMNYMQRWASTPSFRRWWPLLKGIYGEGFRRFAEERFALKARRIGAVFSLAGPYACDAREVTQGFAWKHWQERFSFLDLTGKRVFTLQLKLPGSLGASQDLNALQVGLAFVHLAPDESGKVTASWKYLELFVPPGFGGSGIAGTFLDQLLEQFREGVELSSAGKKLSKVDVIRVSLITPKDKKDFSPFKRTDVGHRHERTDTVNFYKSRGFRYQSPDNGGATELIWERRTPTGKS